MAKVEFVWTILTDSGERAWILDQEIDSGADSEDGAMILEGQLSQKKYTRHEGLVDWLQSLPKEEGPIRPPFDIFISTFVNKKGVTSVQRIEVSSQATADVQATPRRPETFVPQERPSEQKSWLRSVWFWVIVLILVAILLPAILQSTT